MLANSTHSKAAQFKTKNSGRGLADDLLQLTLLGF